MVDCAPRLNPLTTRQLMTAVDCRLSKLRYKVFDWLRCAGRPIVTRPVLGLESHAPANDGALIAAKSYGWPLHRERRWETRKLDSDRTGLPLFHDPA